MRTGPSASIGTGWIDKTNLYKIASWTLVFWAIIWGMAPWLYRPVVQPIRNAWVLSGHGLASFPIWGYSLLILLLGSVAAVVVLQSFLGALATAALMVRLHCLVPQVKWLITALFLLSLPWLSFMAFAYQMPMSSAFAVFALLALEMAITSGKNEWGIAAGTLFGIAQNFRSELLLLPGAILAVVFMLRSLHLLRCLSSKPVAVAVGIAIAFQVPWAVNCYLNGGRFSLSESNLGHVAFIGLGNVPSNSWKIIPSDEFAQETMEKAGLHYSSLSFEGDEFLKRRFVEAVRQDPVGYAKCIWRRLVTTAYYPFGYVLPAEKPAERQAVAELIVKVIRPWANRTVVAAPERTGSFISRTRVVLGFLYAIMQGTLVRAVSLLGIIGFFLAMGKAPFGLSQPIILCLGIALVYRFGMNVALSSSGKYMTGVYLCYLPFAANTLWIVVRRFHTSNRVVP